MNFEIEQINQRSTSTPSDELTTWRGICREFGCSENQIQELYAGGEGSESMDDTLILAGTEWSEQLWRYSRGPQN